MRASHLTTAAVLAAALACAPAAARADQHERHGAGGPARGRAEPRAAAPSQAAPPRAAEPHRAPRAGAPTGRSYAPGPRAYAPSPRTYSPAPRAYGQAVPRGSVPQYRYEYTPPVRGYGYSPRYGYGRGYGYGHGYRSYGPPVLVYPAPYGWRPYGYGPGWSLSFYFGRPYGAYGYGYGPPPAYGYYAVSPGVPYGALRIVDAPPNAQVFVDGYYAGVVDDYDGVFQHLNLEVGAHRVEIEVPGYQRLAFDVYIRPGETITYRAGY